jgi:mersacidin/lichenicidin family type 2 lantibiotic
MSSLDIIRAWKDEDYRLSLSDSQRALLPDSPVGLVELSDIDMSTLAGGGGSSSSCKPGGWGKTGNSGRCQANKHKKHKHHSSH